MCVCVCVCVRACVWEIWYNILQGKPDVSVTSTEEPNLFIAVGEVYLYMCVRVCTYYIYNCKRAKRTSWPSRVCLWTAVHIL